MQRTRRTALNLLKLTVSLSLIVYLVFRMDFGRAWSLIGAFDVRYLVPILLLSLSGILISACKWSLVLRASGLHPPLWKLLRLFWIGTFFNNFLPGRTGGDLIRAYGIAHDAENRIRAALSVAVDRGFGLAALVGIACVALLSAPGVVSDSVRLAILSGGAGLCAISLLALKLAPDFSRRLKEGSPVRRLLIEASTVGAALLRHPVLLSTVVVLSVCYQIAMILSNYGVARGLGIEAAPGAFFYLIPITAVITMFPISVNGLGVREGAYALAFAQIGLTPEAAVTLSIVATLCMGAVSLIGGVFYALGPIRVDHHADTSTSFGVPGPIPRFDLKPAEGCAQK